MPCRQTDKSHSLRRSALQIGVSLVCDVVPKWLILVGWLGSHCLVAGCAIPGPSRGPGQLRATVATSAASAAAVTAAPTDATGRPPQEAVKQVGISSRWAPAETATDDQPLNLATAAAAI